MAVAQKIITFFYRLLVIYLPCSLPRCSRYVLDLKLGGAAPGAEVKYQLGVRVRGSFSSAVQPKPGAKKKKKNRLAGT